jgi:hypothetical protein
MQSLEVMRALLGTILMCSATALAAPGDAPPPAPMGPSGSAQPIDPYQRGPATSPGPVTAPDTTPPTDASPAAPAPSQQQPPANAPQPDTQRTPPDHPPPPASEQKPNPEIDQPGPAPVDTPAPPVKDQQSSRDGSGSAAKTDVPASNAPGNVEPKAPGTVDATASNAPGNVEPAPVVEPRGPEIDVENAPPACRDAGKLAHSRDRQAALSAKISFAICTANAALAPLQLVDAEASVQEVDRVTSNSIALLGEVAHAGDPKWAIVALHAEGDLLSTMAKRMMDTVPANQPAELRDMRTQMLQPHLQPWIERAREAFAEVDRLARANPRLAKSQIVASAVDDSRKRMGTGVATK